jgi:hypothetical protein
MDQKIASAYDQAAAQLQELRDAYAQAGDIGGFQMKLRAFRVRYSNRPAMLRGSKNCDSATAALARVPRGMNRPPICDFFGSHAPAKIRRVKIRR